MVVHQPNWLNLLAFGRHSEVIWSVRRWSILPNSGWWEASHTWQTTSEAISFTLHIDNRRQEAVLFDDLLEADYPIVVENHCQFFSACHRLVTLRSHRHTTLVSLCVLPWWNRSWTTGWAARICIHGVTHVLVFEGVSSPFDYIITHSELFWQTECLSFFDFQLNLILATFVLIVKILLL